MKTSEEVAATFHKYFTPALDAGESAFQHGQSPSIYWTFDLAGPTTSMGRLQREVYLPQPKLHPPTPSISHADKFMALSLDYLCPYQNERCAVRVFFIN
jgi:hypothetical protein